MKTLIKLLLVLLPLSTLQAGNREVYEYIVSCEIQHADIVYRQFLLETGHGTSYAFLHRNNTHGWGNGKMSFGSWQESIEYYRKWQLRHYRGGDYYRFLERIRYASSPSYVATLKKIRI